MKRWGLLTAILLCTMLVHKALAQDIIYSGYEKYDLRSGDFSVIGKVGGKLYTYRSSTEGFFLDMWDDQMVRQSTVILDFFPTKIYETRFIAYPDKIIALYQSLERGKVVQHAAQLDAASRLIGEPLRLDSAKTGFFGSNRDYFSSVVSEDKHYFAVYAANVKGAELELSATVLDDQLHQVRRFTKHYEGEKGLDRGEAMLGNDGTFYIPAVHKVGNQDYADAVTLLSIEPSETVLRRSPLPLKERFAASTFMRVDNSNNRIYIGGFYSEKKNGNYDGVIYAQYNIAAHALENQKMLAFDDRLKEATGERNKKRAFNDYQVRQLIVKKDGGFVMISESYEMTTRNIGSPYGYSSFGMGYSPFMSNRTIREYRYGDILSLSYNANGEREWNAFVRKEQYSQEDGGLYSSYALLNTGGSLGFLYNDFSSRRLSIQLATVDGDGKIAMHPLNAAGNEDPSWLPRSGKQVAARELIVPCLRKRQICFAKIIF